ncbi:MAG: GyrI-like domain-containing protein [Theionarchaea archaeon]|nr:MAG: hypothetical protein AYK18_14890 [Theionarchaea archaeon DG-70]MBU7010331.1 GyrI-like domain-containing protein [Theionarchaea archaeon]
MSLKEAGIVHKKTDEILIASIHFRREYKDILLKFRELFNVCGDYVCGSPIAVYDYGVYTDGVDIEACFPVTQAVHTDEVTSRMLESVEVLSLIHGGPYENVRESYQKLYSYFRDHGIVATNLGREIYLEFNPENFENNVTELQAVLHKWDDRLAKNVERVLGEEAREKVMKERDTFTLESTIDERAQWVTNAMERLDELTNDTQKYAILSECAHDFSEKRIADLKAVYEQTGDIDEVLKAMRKDPGWYENPIRKGNTIYVKKIPFNKEGYEKATTEIEKKKNYCHCSLIKDYLDEISPTFCYCGSGWYRQQWEGILGKPVKIEILKSLTKGDCTCEMAIHLPENV